MIELDRKVFGSITTKEIIGALPPESPDTQNNLEKELAVLLEELKSLPKEELGRLLDRQAAAEKHVNSRPGAMALAQSKIQLFNEYNRKYVDKIKERLEA